MSLRGNSPSQRKSEACERQRNCYERLAVLVLLGTQTTFLAYSATTHSPTQLEPAFLASGISHWKFGRFELYRVNPPLVRMVAALPVMAVGCETDWSNFSDAPGSRSEFAVGADFIKANGPDSIPLFFYARWACIPFTLVGGYFAYRWSKELYGGGAGLVTLTLYSFEPNLLAHGELITPDAAATSFGIMAGYTFWKWLKTPTWTNSFLAGTALGLAELAKMTWLILFLLWPALWFTWKALATKTTQESADSIHPPFKQLILILILPIYMVNLFYAFDGSGTPLKNFNFVSHSLNGQKKPGELGNCFENSLLGVVPAPLPKQYLLGFDAQKKDFEDFVQKSYLCGEWKDGGWWYYYIYGLLVKVPCGTGILFATVFLWRLFIKTQLIDYRDELVLTVPATSLLIFVSAQTEINAHLRYVFPVLGLCLIYMGQIFLLLKSCVKTRKIMVASMLLYSIVSSLAFYPHHLAYFNDLVGGPRKGHGHLLGSNLDWGQDWLAARDYFDCKLGGFSNAIPHSACQYEFKSLLYQDSEKKGWSPPSPWLVIGSSDLARDEKTGVSLDRWMLLTYTLYISRRSEF